LDGSSSAFFPPDEGKASDQIIIYQYSDILAAKAEGMEQRVLCLVAGLFPSLHRRDAMQTGVMQVWTRRY
jgi:hypothetical protein